LLGAEKEIPNHTAARIFAPPTSILKAGTPAAGAETGISLESRDLGAENKAVTDTTFIRFRGPQAHNDRVEKPWIANESVLNSKELTSGPTLPDVEGFS
jgi:hypothetical protein